MDRALKPLALGDEGILALAPPLGVQPEIVGALEPPAGPFDWRLDLDATRDDLHAAGDAVDRGVAAGDVPLLLAAQCTVAMTTLPAVARHHPEAVVLWLDAHGDLNTPDTSASAFLGGMPLAAAIGAWDSGLAGGRLDPANVVLCGLRDLDPGEEALIADTPLRVVEPAGVADAVAGRPLFVHLDCDVLSGDVLPAAFPAPGGMQPAELGAVLRAAGEACARLVGLEVTAFSPPPARRAEIAATVAACIAELLEGARVR